MPIRSFRERVLEPELMDHLPEEEAAPNLADIVRLNRKWGGHRTLVSLLDRTIPRDEAFTILDVGAASGDMGGVISAQRPKSKVTGLDSRLSHMARCASPKVVADAFHMPFPALSFDYVFCSLFLHHFTNSECETLMREFARIARKRVLVIDLWRNPVPYYFLAWTHRIFDWNPVTVYDGTRSVAASFQRHELVQLMARAGLSDIRARTHFPACRISLSARAL